MVNFESKAGDIKSSEIDLSKIYASKQNALEGLNNVTISENNTSWQSDNLTYSIQDDNQTVVISNGGVPIGFTTVEALKGVAGGGSSNSGALVPGEELIIEQNSYQENMDDTIEDTGSTIPAEEAPAMEIQPEYNEEPAEEVEQEQGDSPLVPGEEAPTEELVVEAEVTDEEAQEILAETQQPPENPINVETIDAEIEDSAAQEVISSNDGSGLNPNSSLYKKLGGNTAMLDTMISWLKSNGFNDVQVSGIIANSAAESGLTLDAQNPTSTAHGLFQWLSNRYPDSWDFDSQMSHMMVEYSSTRTDRHGVPVSGHYGDVSTPEEAAKIWCTYFEGYSGWIGDREQYARDCYDYIRGY